MRVGCPTFPAHCATLTHFKVASKGVKKPSSALVVWCAVSQHTHSGMTAN